MKSPLTGKEMPLRHELRTITFRKEEIKTRFQFYLCEDTGEKFTTTELDEYNLLMVEHAYRVKNHIPQREEIIEIRGKYGLSAIRMGEILGFGQNTYGLYEKGELPSLANANLIKLARDPFKFRSLVEDWNPKSENTKFDLLKRIDRLIYLDKQKLINLDDYLMGDDEASILTGYSKPSLEKFIEMIVFFSHMTQCYKTKMNKLLFYSDFSFFKYYGNSISGIKYKAINYGPVPNMFETIFENLAINDVIDIEYVDKTDGIRIEKLVGREDRKFNPEVFGQEELAILEKIASHFKDISTNEIVEISHLEKGWLENIHGKQFISYEYAVELKAI
ncbi:type II toxin-antitoxin system antitoxin SocA domain-containing protein [Algoriphagus marincola]|uniref:type II toxin-antitoxin system antitoxin SocA domain-containing protein n=1 Tax=Algoriphagus marincola TaxID=264027 RepID=UPI0003F68F11|nr:type II toxin-antitoxin system antitoxin SocA domain-containing protein [Algoriphagus marincola]